jgi:hypothetical protein
MLKAALLLVFVLIASAAAPSAAADEGVDYLRQVKPIFRQKCYACHGALKQNSGLRLDTALAIRQGGESGAAVAPGKPQTSLLIERVSALDDSRMPPLDEGTPLTLEEIDLVRRWIAAGATAPADERPQIDPATHWSHLPPVRPAVPVARASLEAPRSDGANPIDAFLATEHQRRGLVARPAAAPEVWLRRVYLDLIGLPPTREELQAFLADPSVEARGRVVDRLLARPQYGERWGRHWMDVWRYSDWYGSRAINEIRYSQRHIWRWRDWIVEALNADKPYDQMIVEMLAGDELAPDDPSVLRATGFITRNWYKFDRDAWISAAVEHPAQAFLAVTLRCCRCHDHKYDPLAQEEYYRFRAFFEPHEVRTDRLALDTPTEKDATLGAVLKDGISRVYDKQLDAATYVFLRGDSRSPDKQRPVLPGVPPMLLADKVDLPIVPVKLPLAAWYPAMKPDALQALLAQSAAAVEQARTSLDRARLAAAAAEEKLASAEAAGRAEPVEKPPIFHDDFSVPRPDDWRIVSGQWLWENGRLVQRSLEDFATIVSTKTHPADFKARWKYRPLQQGGLRSIGFSYDYLDQGNSNDVYTHLSDQSQSVQAFHRQDGQQVYPPAGIVKTDSLKVGEEVRVEIEVRGSNLTIWLNGERKLDYVLPSRRADGKFALWTLQGTAEFSELWIGELPATVADLRRERQAAADSAALGEKKLATAQAEQASLAARLAAEQLRYAGRPMEEAQPSMLAASRAEREVAVAKSAEGVLQAEQHLARLTREHAEAERAATVPPAALAEAEAKLAATRKTLDDARLAAANADGGYTPLGEQYPTTSSGRRLALARWIADGRNPRTARVAINHIWLRHFGRALVPTVDDFGLNGQPPSHPELLDWLACELVERGWRMKAIHRLIVLSAAYGRSSAPGEVAGNQEIDHDNIYLWRMNSRRMEAEVVRDSVLATSADLDTRLGGPEIPEAEGLTSPRRSFYFRATPNEKMKLLELFDAADPNACYRRRESIVPQQALALLNSSLVQDHARALAERLAREAQQSGADTGVAADRAFVVAAFETVLSRPPRPEEVQACLGFLDRNVAQLQQPNLAAFPAGGGAARVPAADPRQRARENLLLVLYSHHEFVTVR